MKFSETWLRELVNPAVDIKTLADQLSMAGLEVEAVTPVAGVFSNVVVGQVISVIQHPNASKLHVCQVIVTPDGNNPLQIVCGAANVAANMCVPVALVGAMLPDNIQITQANLRGITSNGMICSAAELGLEEKSHGIMVLPVNAPIGQNIREYLQLDDNTIEVNLTPDRADCLSLIGIACEVGVINKITVAKPSVTPIIAGIADSYTVHLINPQLCPHYACRIIRNINPNAQTPLWMRERLRRSNIRNISPVVDVTNYVMLELGQPMHGFDLDKLNSHIEVRVARVGEKLVLLDGREITLHDNTLIIADAVNPLALAGIMGGETSAVTNSTSNILLESAFFTPLAINGQPRLYGLTTDSSHRFERGVDPTLQVQAIERATKLLLDIAGGNAGPVVDVVATEYLPRLPNINLRRDRITQLLGITLADNEIIDILNCLGMNVESTNEGWKIIPPHTRFDINLEVDLIAELGRIYGYTKIPNKRITLETKLISVNETNLELDRAKDLLINRGYHEVITYSFIDAELQQLLDPTNNTVALANPISKDMSTMRTSLWPGLLLTARYNQYRQISRIRIFETGLAFNNVDNKLTQLPMLAGLITNSVAPEQWGIKSQMADFFDAKADVEALLHLIKLNDIRFVPAEHLALHPGQTARILHGTKSIGWIGTLHPDIQRHLDFSTDIIVFELNLTAIANGNLPIFQPISKFPFTRRDLAIVVDKQIPSDTILDNVRTNGQKFVQDILLFDVYTGNLSPQQKSLGIGLVLQDANSTLHEADIDATISKILRGLEQNFGATLRI
jgi:phenylalanyl-tRNA synthetase beta chain